jgi:hypothetical protein
MDTLREALSMRSSLAALSGLTSSAFSQAAQSGQTKELQVDENSSW